MRISQPIKKQGYWWLPENPDRQVPGTLKIEEPGDISLEIIGSFTDDLHSNKRGYPRILGVTEKSEPVTLEDNLISNRSLNLPSQISIAKIISNKAFLGVHFQPDQPLEFTSLTISVEGIDEWLSISGFEIKNDFKSNKTDICYTVPEQIALKIDDETNAVIFFSSSFPAGKPTKEAKITQKAYFRIETKHPTPLDKIMDHTFKLNNFFCFAIDKTVAIDSISVSSKHIRKKISDEKQIEIPIKLYFRTRPTPEKLPKIDSCNMLLNYESIKNNFQTILKNWLDKYETLEPAFNLYFSAATGEQAFLESEFLALAQATETLHRRTTKETLMHPEKYKQLTDALMMACPDELKEWLGNKINFGNELPLRTRTCQMLEPFQRFFGSEEDLTALIKYIVVTRNYYTHWDPRLEKKAAKGTSLLHLNMKIEALIQLHILSLLGFTQEQITSIYHSNTKLSQEIRLDKNK